jgi:hypothetical protein
MSDSKPDTRVNLDKAIHVLKTDILSAFVRNQICFLVPMCLLPRVIAKYSDAHLKNARFLPP